MRKLGVNIISTSKDETSREAVYLLPEKGTTRKGMPKLHSITFHQWKTGGKWSPPKPL